MGDYFVFRSFTRFWLALALALSGAWLATPASADTLPPDAADPETVTADPLPTVQHNGVAWSTVVVGNKVFVAGNFTEARPAGTAVGSGVARTHLLAFDITTGELDPSFAPVLDGQALTIVASPDQKTIYVGGEFQKVNGLWRVRAAAFDVATGALKPFAPVMGSTVRAITATNDAVYLGGDFNSVSGTARRFLAAVDPTSGALRPFDPSPDATVTALTMNASGSKLIVGGRFQNIAGQAWYGMAALDPAMGTALPWAATSTIRNAGTKSSLTSLRSTPDGVYMTGYVFGAGGNFEGTARVDNESGQIIWIADCHGDHYTSWSFGGVVYDTSHSHYCGNFGGFPQTASPWLTQFSGALTNDVRTVLTKEQYGNYFNYAGQPGPKQLNWFPTWLPGTATVSKQAAWSISGNDTYLVFAGEFIGLNGAAQQGLVRFAKKGTVTPKVAPSSSAGLTPSLVSVKAGEVYVGWQATHDRDNEAITYKVFRNFTSLNNTPVYVTTVNSLFYRRPTISFVDRPLAPGSTQTYTVYAFDPHGNRVAGSAASVVVAGAAEENAYMQTVLNDGPTYYFPLADSGTTLSDHAGANSGLVGTSATRGVEGVNGKATSFNGAVQTASATGLTLGSVNTVSVEAWFKTTSTAGGQIVGNGTNKTNGSSWTDRHIYIDGTGRVTFGVYSQASKTITSAAGFNDGGWHHVVGTLGPNGTRLYIDGKLIGSRGDATFGRNFSGFWRIGGENITSEWPNRPTNGYFTGTIDEVAIYDKVLTPTQIDAHYTATGRTSTQPQAPSDTFGAAVYQMDPDLYWRLGEKSGTTAKDASRNLNDATVSNGVTWGAAGGLYNHTGTAATFNGTSGIAVASKRVQGGVGQYTAGVWFKTTTTRGGKLIGFGNAASGLSSSTDRHIYMQDNGKLAFAAFSTSATGVITPNSYNDGAWHFAIGTQGPEGLKLYVDGKLVGTSPETRSTTFDGFWRIGGDTTWGSTSAYFAGVLDEAVVFSRVLGQQDVANLYSKGIPPVPNKAPTASFTATVQDLSVAFDGSASSDADGTVASYKWNFGDGATDTVVSPTHVYTAAGTYSVTLTVTDDDGDTATSTKSVTVTEPPNVLPTADFTMASTGKDLVLKVDASGSSDSDGTIQSYAWDFGDGSTGSGVTASHTYASEGTYAVTLTVTDNRGGKDVKTASRSMVIVNDAPTASFSASALGLDVTVDGSASSDPDGSIASWSWQFGDGETAVGATPAPHRYAQPGTYTVTLTVTDNRGATNTTTRSVSVTSLFAADLFARTVASGWGSADLGGAWSACGATCNSLFSVSGGAGKVSLAAGKGPEIYLASLAVTDADVQAQVTLDRVATGGGTYYALVARGTYREGYRGKVRVMPDGSMQLSIVRAVAGAETALTGTVTLPAGTFAAGDTFNLRMQAQGLNGTALRFKAWESGTAEPGAWQLSANDTTAALQKASSAGFWFYSSASTTNGPAILSVDEFKAGPIG